MAGQGLHVHDGVPHGPGEGQVQTDRLILKLGPQNTGGIQQLQTLIHGDPLLAAGHAGAVAGLGRLFLGDFIDEGGLAHVGDTHDHGPHRAAHLALFFPPGDLFLQRPAHDGGELLHPCPAAGVALQHRDALAAEAGSPLLAGGGVGLVGPVEDDHARLAAHQVVDVRVPAGDGDAGVDDLRHHVHVFEVFPDHPPGLGHVAGIPLDVHGLVLSFPGRGRTRFGLV